MKKAIKKTNKKIINKNSKLVGSELISFKSNKNGKISIKEPVKHELGKQIKSANELIKLSIKRKVVYNIITGTTIPASFYLHLHVIDVYRLVDCGYLFVKK
jgi:hypothetical protein